MLSLSRRVGKSLVLSLSDDIDPNTPVGEIFSDPIIIKLLKRDGKQFKIGIDAPLAISIVRDELINDSSLLG